jgi:putative peptidoglycan lipid II flippase
MEAKTEIRDEPPTPLHRGRTVGIVTILTLVVSGFGYIREAVLAGHFGVSATMDAYFGAIFVPSNIYLILVVGTLSPVFIPLILQSDGAHDPARLSEIVSVVANFVFVVLVGFVSVGLLTIRYWLPALFPGFDVATIAMATQLTYIILPAVVFLGLAGIITAVLNAFHRFALPALAPALSSIVVIAAVLMAHGKRAIVVVGLATTVGFFLQFLALLPPVVALRIRYVPVFNFRHPAIAKLLRLGGPLLLYLVVCSASSVV